MAHKTSYSSLPNASIEADLGRRLQEIRLGRNISQAQLAAEAGVARRTITRLESGGGVSLETFIRVLRALGLLDRLTELLPDTSVRPIEEVRGRGRRQQRARPDTGKAPARWTWGDEADDS
jgi:transcriptional regulator with XRE-family HTH domain